jgi:hypothetical protein
VELEKHNVPVATICTDEFFGLGKAEAEFLGFPGLPICTIPHPMADRLPEQIEDIAVQSIDEIIHILTSDSVQIDAEYREKTIQNRRKTKLKHKSMFGDVVAVGKSSDKLKAPDSLDAVNRIFYQRGWTDGLPIIPPTEERVDNMIRHYGWDPKSLIGHIVPMQGEATVLKIAINAVMAGCLPEHLPVVIAATRAMIHEKLNLYALQTTTHPCTILVLVNGPLPRELDINSGYNAMGQGSIGNAGIGRAVRLLLTNVGGASPGVLDRATLGTPAKYSFCFAENEEENPWEPFHVERGYAEEISTVTVASAEGPHNVNDHGSATGEEILTTISGVLATPGNNNIYLGGEPFVVLGPEHAAVIARSGFSKKDIKRFLFENARVPMSSIPKSNLDRFIKTNPDRFVSLGPDDHIPLVDDPDEIKVIVAGGQGRHSTIIPTFGGHTRAVTEPITDANGDPIIPG